VSSSANGTKPVKSFYACISGEVTIGAATYNKTFDIT
jgi:hypothetical protein